MKNTIKKNVTHAGIGHTCKECAKGHWNDDNRNYIGERFMIYCPFGTYGFSRRVQCNVTYGEHDACERFIAGEKGGAI